MQLTLETQIERTPLIAPKIVAALRRLGIRTLRDLLWHLPQRYEDFSREKRIEEAAIGETVTLKGRISEIQNVRTWKKRMALTQAVVEDQSGSIKVIWFNQPFLARNIKPGDAVVLSGKIHAGKEGPYLSSPSYEVVRAAPGEHITGTETHHAGRLVPVYPETQGITSRWIRFLVKKFLPLAQTLPDPLPPAVRARQNLVDLKTAITDVHFPKTSNDALRAKDRLRFEEMFVIECAALRAKARLAAASAPKIPMDVALTREFVASLPFSLTNDQRKATFQILRDMESGRPMNRLLCGDVGSGKTVVAAMASLNAVRAGFQVAFMAPTEVLAQQHFREIAKLMKPFKIRIALLTGATSRATPKKLAWEAIAISRPKLFKEISNGDIDILIGTHALISNAKRKAQSAKRLSGLKPEDPLTFKNLALAIVDEQHRFGVEQRARLAKIAEQFSPTQSAKRKAQSDSSVSDTSPMITSQKMLPHFLTMTATPIPRTLALTIFGDLDISLIIELPKERRKVETSVVHPHARNAAYNVIRAQIMKGRQAFIICPLVEQSEKLEAKAATKEYERLQKEVFPDLHIALLHGRMKPKEKELIMRGFKAGKHHILVSTSVVEVGVDVQNATVMVIEGAERFGLAQLYQFRGRVGRGPWQSYCFLFTGQEGGKSGKRFKALLDAESGAALAQADLEIRGPGELTGFRQAGVPDIAMSALMDLELIERAREEAMMILTQDPSLRALPPLALRVARIAKDLHFA